MRMRFTKSEKAAFVKDAAIEWRNGRYWYPGRIVDGVIHNDPYGSGFQHMLIKSTHSGKGGGIVRNGEITYGSPTSVRVRNV